MVVGSASPEPESTVRGADAPALLARYEALYDSISSLSFVVDGHCLIASVNAHAAAELGYPERELVGTSLLTLLDERDRDVLQEQLRAAIRRSGVTERRDLCYRRRDGTCVWTASAVRAVPENGQEAVFLVVGQDVTRRKSAEQELAKREAELGRLSARLALAEERERRRIAGLLHDDVGHSLALAQIRLGALLRDLDGDVAGQVVPVRALIADAIRHTRTLTFDLSSPVLYELGLEAAIQSVLDRMADATGLTFEFRGGLEPARLSEDVSVLVFRSVRELLLNAVKHARARRVAVSVEPADAEVRIVVTDDGVGFDGPQVSGNGAAGLSHGLSSVRAHLDGIGGRLDLDAASGRGTRCVIVVPVEGSCW